jgi:hypothetical protein
MPLPASAAIFVLQVPTPSASASVDPAAGSYGFAAYLIGGFFALGLIMLVAFLLSRRPRSAAR